MARRVIDVYWDVNEGLYRSASGKVLSSLRWPTITYLEDVLFRIRLVTNGALAQYTGIESGAAITATLDVDRGISSSSGFIAYAPIANVNVDGDWVGDSSGDDQADESVGEITVRIDTDTSRAATVFSTDEGVLYGWLELRVEDSASSGALVFHTYQMPVILRNSLNVAGAASTDAGPSGTTGLVNVSSGATAHTVSDQEWASTPIAIEATLVIPNGGVKIFVAAVDSITTTGFVAYFSSQIPASGYKLYYRAIFS